jgi:hypothetical protein
VLAEAERPPLRGGLRTEKIRMLDLVYVLGVIAVFTVIGVVARGVAKL